MENTSAFVTGLIAMILAIASIWVPLVNINIFITLTWLGTFAAITGGLLLMLSGIWGGKGLSGAGFGVGMTGWALIIISSIYGIAWNQAQIAGIVFEELLFSMLYAILVFGNPLFFFVFYDPYSGIHQTGLVGAIIYLCFMAAALVLGTISYSQVQKEKF